MSSFVKIYGSILRSSVWQQPLATKVVWITMLALADENGLVEASVPGLAATAGVMLEECEAALACFLAPDKYSGSKVEDGRRIREVRGGWLIINHGYYRELRTERQTREANRIASKRAQAKPLNATSNMLATSQHVANVADVAANANAEADTDLGSPLGPPCSAGDQVPEAGANAPADAGGPSKEQPLLKTPEAEKPKRRTKRAPRPVEIPIPLDWSPTEKHVAYAAKHGLDLDREVEAFRGWADGRTQVSWNGTFTTRLANEVKWRRQRGVPAVPNRRFGSAQRDEGIDGFSFFKKAEGGSP